MPLLVVIIVLMFKYLVPDTWYGVSQGYQTLDVRPAEQVIEVA